MSMETLIEVRNKLLLFLPNYWTPVVVDNSGVSVLLLSRQTQITVQRSVVFKSSGEVVVNVHCKEVNSETFLEQSSPPMPLIDSDSESQNYFVDRAVRIVSKVRPMEICAGADIENYTPVWESCEKGVIDNNPYKECRYFEINAPFLCSQISGVVQIAVRSSEHFGKSTSHFLMPTKRLEINHQKQQIYISLKKKCLKN